ncbi:MAG: hypothetical protein ACLUEC_10380 [Coprococcus sp.]
MASLSRMATKCRNCPFVSKCEKKRMEAATYIEPNLTMPATIPSVAEMVSPMVVKHDYRDIKVDENTTITIDLEEMKRQMTKDFYRKAGIGFYPGA